MVSKGRTDGLMAGSCFGTQAVSGFTFRNAEIVKALFMDIYFTLTLCLVCMGKKVINKFRHKDS